jgi:hypothetical protein
MHHELDDWLNVVSGDGWQWYVKYLAGNDTLLTKAHQAGPYIPKGVVFDVFPSIANPSAENPRISLPALIDSHRREAQPSIIWYNNKLRGGTRNECHFTGWGGISSALLDPENTGALCVFAFYRVEGRDAEVCRIWIARDLQEEQLILERVGPVEPGAGIVYQAGIRLSRDHHLAVATQDSSCRLRRDEIPPEWLLNFPEAKEIVQESVRRARSALRQDPDGRLLRRRDCEFEIFRSLEEAVALPRITEGFATVDLFVDFANSLTNRRKSRSGASLELQTKRIFEEESLPFSHDEESEDGKRPDFIFPSSAAYQDANVSSTELRMLAVKTTCKDRWRQVIDEAARLPEKFLLTLQNGVSLSQYAQMRTAGIRLVIPKKLHTAFDDSIRSELISLASFIADTRSATSS